MRLIYNTDSARLQKGFDDTTPVTISEILRAERTAEVPLELFLVDNNGGYDTPGSSDYEVVLGRAGQKLNTGILTLTWTGTTEAIDLSKPKLRERIEAALNSIAEIATAGGVDVETLDSGRAYSITFRSAGSRAAITASVAESIQPAGVYLSEATAGNGSTKEVQILTLEEAALAEVTTSGWSANSAPALAISTIVEGTASTREVVEVSVSNDPAPGSFFVLSDSQPISTEATAAQVKAILNTLLSDDIGSVKKTGQRKWQITYASNGDKTALSAGSGNLVKRPSVTATLALTTTGLAYAAKEDGTPLSVGFTLRKGEEVYYQEDITLLEPAAELTSSSAPLSPTGSTVFKLGGTDVAQLENVALTGLSYDGTTLSRDASDVASVFGRTGTVAATSGDYTAAQVTNALDKTGDTMSGELAMGTSKITGVGDGTSAQDAVTKTQLDAKASSSDLSSHTGSTSNPHSVTASQVSAVPLDGGVTINGSITMGGTLDMQNNSIYYAYLYSCYLYSDLDAQSSYKVTNLTDGSASGDAVNKGQLDLKLDLSGGTMSGGVDFGSYYISNGIWYGGTLSGDLDASSAKLTNLAAGSSDNDSVRFDQLRTSINTQTGTTYTLVAGDARSLVRINNASDHTLTVPDDLIQPGDQITIMRIGAGAVEIEAASGVTINSVGGKKKLANQFSAATLVCITKGTGASEFDLIGDLTS